MAVQGLDRGPGWILTPEDVDQPGDRHDRARVQGENAEHGSLAGAVELCPPGGADRFDRAQHLHFPWPGHLAPSGV